MLLIYLIKNDKKILLLNLNKKIEKTYLDLLKKENSNKKNNWCKTVSYDNDFFETGPLARAIISNRKFIKDIHKTYNDSSFTRILARMDELAHLLQNTKELIKKVDISEESFIKPKFDLKKRY